MFFEYTQRLFLVLALVGLVSLSNAADKPTSLQETCVTADCHVDYAEKAHVHGPVELGDCKACHESVEPAEHTYKLAHQGRDLCESCHLDQAIMKNVHDPLVEGDCMQCHDPHASDAKFLLVEKDIQTLCASCHETAKHDDYLHGPVAVGECTICHDSHSSDYEKLLTVDPKELCVSCHVITKNELDKFEFIHEPAKGDCVGCHNPHGADNAQMLKAQAPDMCYPCHEEIEKTVTTSMIKHSVVSQEGGCLECHTPHASTVKFLLKNDPASLCASCHDKPVGINKNEVLAAFSEQLHDKKFMHGPVAEKNCNGCHTAHGSEHFRLLAKEYPKLFYAPYSEQNYDLCFGCHPKDIALADKTKTLTDFRNGDQNLHFLHVNKDRRGRTCRACHQTHASDLPKHIRESVPYGVWDLPIQFGKTETGGTCTPGCHLPKDYDREKAVDYTVSKKVEETKPVPPKESVDDVKEEAEDKSV